MQLDAQAFEVGNRRGLRRAVRARARDAAEAGDARDADERAVPRRAHRRDERLERVHDAHDVGVENRPERRQILRVVGERPARDAGIGDHDVRRAEARAEIGGGRGKRRRVANISRVDRDARGVERLRDARELGFASREQADARTPRGVMPGERGADARRRAGDEDGGGLRGAGQTRAAISSVRRAPSRPARRSRAEAARACRRPTTT